MDGYTSRQIIAAEGPLLAVGAPLMVRASSALATQIEGLLGKDDKKILFLVGPGRNGGDALFAAAALRESGYETVVVPMDSKVHTKALERARTAGVTFLIKPNTSGWQSGPSEEKITEAIKGALPGSAIVVDGILGTGSAGHAALHGGSLAAVKTLLEAKTHGARFKTVAVDLPSGLDPDTGKNPGGTVLPADITVTFGACKAGLLLEEGPKLAGEIHVVDIGLMPALAGVEPVVRTD